MILKEQLKKNLKNNLSLYRYEHVLRVTNAAKNIFQNYTNQGYKFNFTLEQLEIACLAHDLAKEVKYDDYDKLKKVYPNIFSNNNKQQWHGILGRMYLKKKYKVNNNKILMAVEHHTYGAYEISNLGKILYIADYIEPGRENKFKNLLNTSTIKINNVEITLDNLFNLIVKEKNKNLIKSNIKPNSNSIHCFKKIITNKYIKEKRG